MEQLNRCEKKEKINTFDQLIKDELISDESRDKYGFSVITGAVAGDDYVLLNHLFKTGFVDKNTDEFKKIAYRCIIHKSYNCCLIAHAWGVDFKNEKTLTTTYGLVEPVQALYTYKKLSYMEEKQAYYESHKDNPPFFKEHQYIVDFLIAVGVDFEIPSYWDECTLLESLQKSLPLMYNYIIRNGGVKS